MNLSQLIPRRTGYSIGLNLYMINDTHRNIFYDNFLKQHVKGKVCSEAGFGSGILTMIALQHGAEHVYAYEMDSTIFEIGKEIITRMGYADRVTFIHDKFDNRYESEILFHELFMSTIWGEGLYEIHNMVKGKTHILPSKMRCEIKVNSNQEKVNKQHWLFTDNLRPHYTYNPDDADPDYGTPQNIRINTGVDYLNNMNEIIEDIQYSDEYYVISPDNGNLHARRRINLDFTETIGSYEVDLNHDDLPEVITVPINIPQNSLITCKYSSHELKLQRVDGHWRYDKIVYAKEGGSHIFKQRTADGTWWLEKV